MKTKEELNEIKEKIETLNKKLSELTDEELKQVSGGDMSTFNWSLFKKIYMERINPLDKYPELYGALLSNNWVKAECMLIPWIAKGEKDLILIVKDVQDNQ